MNFTLVHGFVVSLALHGTLLLPFIVRLEPEPPEEPSILVVELQGFVAETQSEQQVQQQTKGQAMQQEHQAAQAAQSAQQAVPEAPQEEAAQEAERALPPPPSPEQQNVASPSAATAAEKAAQAGRAGAAEVKGTEEQKQAQTVAQKQDEAIRLLAYARQVAKKVNDHIVKPEGGSKARLNGSAKVSFAVELDGSIRPGSIRIASSSGEARLDAAALRTVEANAPFPTPPRPFTVTVNVGYNQVQ